MISSFQDKLSDLTQKKRNFKSLIRRLTVLGYVSVFSSFAGKKNCWKSLETYLNCSNRRTRSHCPSTPYQSHWHQTCFRQWFSNIVIRILQNANWKCSFWKSLCCYYCCWLLPPNRPDQTWCLFTPYSCYVTRFFIWARW